MPVQQYSTIMTIMKPFCCFSSCTATEPNQSVHKLQQPMLPDACSRIHMVFLTEQHTSSVLAATLCARSLDIFLQTYHQTASCCDVCLARQLPCLAHACIAHANTQCACSCSLAELQLCVRCSLLYTHKIVYILTCSFLVWCLPCSCIH